VDPVPDPLLLRKSGSAGNRTRTSGSVGRNYDHRGGQFMAFSVCKSGCRVGKISLQPVTVTDVNNVQQGGLLDFTSRPILR
jgi:hypothetical protein